MRFKKNVGLVWLKLILGDVNQEFISIDKKSSPCNHRLKIILKKVNVVHVRPQPSLVAVDMDPAPEVAQQVEARTVKLKV